jgi:4-hydroxyphenylpyruvate dioxygenase-like putative hemolysin
MGFVNFLSFDDKQINTEYSALMSKVMSNGNGRIKFPINEPAEVRKNHKSRTLLILWWTRDTTYCHRN